MLLANRIVAEHIGKVRGRGKERNPFIYRIHDVPPKEKLIELSNFVKSLGYTLPVDNIQSKDIQRLIDSVKGTDEEELVTEMTLRSMAKAVYSEFNIGHFGLAFDYYTHFTSPIRRYPDLIVHRMLHEYSRGMSGGRKKEYERKLGGLADHCSERERAAVEAERDSIKIAQVEFLKDHVGDVFEATISGVMPFGIFAELKRFGIEGLVRLRNIQSDYFVFDERAKAFKGRNSKKVYRLGDPIHVRVIRVDEINTEIDMELIEEDEYLDEIGGASEDDGRRQAGKKRRSGGNERKSGGSEGKVSGSERKSGGSNRRGGSGGSRSPKKGSGKSGRDGRKRRQR